MNGEEQKKRAVLRQMLKLAQSRSNDAVGLLFMEAVEPEALAEMDLDALLGMKRHGNGAVEIHLVDRGEILSRLFEMLKDSGSEQLDAFLTAVEDGGASR